MARGPSADGTWHRGLEVRAADHRHAVVRAPEGDERTRKGRDFGHHPVQLVLDVQAHVNGHLVVAAASRVYLLAEVAKGFRKAALHRHVYVLIGLLYGEIAGLCGGHHPREGLTHLRGLVLCDHWRRDRHFREHRHVRRRSKTVPRHEVHVQHRIVPNRVVENIRINVAGYCLLRLHLCFVQ